MADQTDPDLFRADPRNKKTYHLRVTAFRSVFTSLAKSIFPLFVSSTIEGIENVPESGPVILAANHVTNFDVLPIQFCLKRAIFFMGKAELFKNPVLDWGYRQLGAFPVHRGEGDEWAMQYAVKVLERGLVLGMFPEGSRSKGNGLRPAKTGVARLAIQTGSPILPVAQHGTQEMFKNLPHRTNIQVKLGQLIFPEPGETTLSLTDRMMYALAEQLPNNQRGVYSYRPAGF